MKKRVLALVLAMSMAFTMLIGCGEKEFDGSQIVAEVGEEKITAGVANFYARYNQALYEANYAAYLGENMWETQADAGVTYEQNVKASIMKTLHSLYVLKMHAPEYGVEITEKDAASIKKAAEKFNESNGIEAIQAVSGDEATVEEVLTLMTIQQRMYDKIVEDMDRNVADGEARQKAMEYVWFTNKTTNDENASVEMTDEQKAEAKKKAEALADKAKAGEDLKKLAEAEELEVVTKTFDGSSTIPSAEVIAAADAMKEGEVSDVIETAEGYYVIKLTSEFDKEATEAKKAEIISQRESEMYNTTCENWMEETEIDIDEHVWAEIDFKKLGVIYKGAEVEE